MACPSHVVCLFCVTAGQNGENLGSDEEQIVQFVYLLYDLTNNKVVTLQHHFVRPTAADDLITETVLTEECKIQTGLPEDAIRNAQPLEHVLDEFERFLSAKEVHPDHGGRPFCFCTDGPLHLRMCLIPECIRKNIALPRHFFRFFDLRKEVRRLYKCEGPINCLKDMLDIMGLEGDQSVEYGNRHCHEMAAIINRFVIDGGHFVQPEIIKEKLEPGVCTVDEIVDDETVVRARGLPWQSSDQDVACFFKGLNVAKGGVALCLSQQGRRNGEALVRFDNKEHKDLALRRHKHHMGQRYIEVYRATGQDFLSVAGGSSSEAQEFLQRHADNGTQVIIRMRGLPYICRPEEVVEFFQQGLVSVEVLDGKNGILFVHQPDGRATGDAFVLFGSEEAATKALTKHRQCIGSRYIELFRSTTAEVQQVLNRSLEPIPLPSIDAQEMALHQVTPIFPSFQASPLATGFIIARTQQQQLITSGTKKDCVRIRGLPYETTVSEILSFLGEYSRHIVYQGVHLIYNSLGSPSGEAFIQMDSEKSADSTAVGRSKKLFYMGNKKCFLEVIQCSGEDMNLVLTTGLSPPAALLPSAAAITGPQLMLPPPPNTLPAPAPIHHPQQMVPSSAVVQNQLMAASVAAANQHHVISTGGAVIAPGIGVQPSSYPPTALYAYGGPLSSQHQQTATVLAPDSVLSVSGPTSGQQQQQHRYAPMTAAAAAAAAYQPIVYWYPSPPMSPQNAFYLPSFPATTVFMKGLPPNAATALHAQDIVRYLDGVNEMTPDVTLIKGSDGRIHCGGGGGGGGSDAYINFGSRADSERSVNDYNRKQMHGGSRFVEMYMM